MNSSRKDLHARKGLHQKNLSTQLSQNAKPGTENQFNLKMKNAAKGMQDSASDKYDRTGARDLKAKMSRKAEAARDYPLQGGQIHVPRKFARRHARGASFNSTGKGLHDRADDIASPPPQVNSLIYDKATLEAEKEKERLRMQLVAQERQRNEHSEPLLASNDEVAERLRENVADRSGHSDQRPHTKQVTFRNANATRPGQKSRAQNNIQYIRPSYMNQTYGGAAGEPGELNAPSHEQTKSGTLSHQPSQLPMA